MNFSTGTFSTYTYTISVGDTTPQVGLSWTSPNRDVTIEVTIMPYKSSESIWYPVALTAWWIENSDLGGFVHLPVASGMHGLITYVGKRSEQSAQMKTILKYAIGATALKRTSLPVAPATCLTKQVSLTTGTTIPADNYTRMVVPTTSKIYWQSLPDAIKTLFSAAGIFLWEMQNGEHTSIAVDCMSLPAICAAAEEYYAGYPYYPAQTGYGRYLLPYGNLNSPDFLIAFAPFERDAGQAVTSLTARGIRARGLPTWTSQTENRAKETYYNVDEAYALFIATLHLFTPTERASLIPVFLSQTFPNVVVVWDTWNTL
jgi:hypothetical protein